MTKSQHTPTPWKANIGFTKLAEIYPDNGNMNDFKIAQVFPHNQEANAALIVKAVNAYGTMVEALEQCLTMDGAVAGRSHMFASARLQAINEIVTAALKTAKGEA